MPEEYVMNSLSLSLSLLSISPISFAYILLDLDPFFFPLLWKVEASGNSLTT